MTPLPSRRRSGAPILAAMLLACLLALAAALVSQHFFDMQPCPWCVIQRLGFVTIALACGLGLLWRGEIARWVTASLAGLTALLGMAAALWQHFRAAAQASCDLTLADRIISNMLQLDRLLPSVFEPRASCAEAAVNLLGVPYDFWSLALFGALAFGALQVLRLRP